MVRTKESKNIETKKWSVVGVTENDDFVLKKNIALCWILMKI